MKGKRQENERKKKMKGEVGAQRGGWSFERRDWSLLKERLGLTEGEVGLKQFPARGSAVGASHARKMKGK